MAVTHFVWDVESDSYMMEKDDTGATTAFYSNTPIPFGKLLSQRRNAATSYYQFDGQRSTRQLTNQNEVVTDDFTYSAFGQPVDTTATTISPFRYIGDVGYYFDAEASTYYVRARTYHVTGGRWLSQDYVSARARSFLIARNARQRKRERAVVRLINLYNYASNNPVLWKDPNGLDKDLLEDGSICQGKKAPKGCMSLDEYDPDNMKPGFIPKPPPPHVKWPKELAIDCLNAVFACNKNQTKSPCGSACDACFEAAGTNPPIGAATAYRNCNVKCATLPDSV